MRLGVGGGDDLRQVQLRRLDVKLGERDQLVVVGEFLDVHPHRAAGVAGVRDEDVCTWSSVQFVHEPAVDSSKGEAACIVRVFHLVYMFQQPEEFR